MKAKESSLIEFYNKLMEEKQRKREKLISDTKDTFFKQNDEPRQLERYVNASIYPIIKSGYKFDLKFAVLYYVQKCFKNNKLKENSIRT